MSGERTVRLPADVCGEAEQWMGDRFPDVEALIVFLLKEIVKDDGSSLYRAEEEIVEQRLKELGYI